MAFPSLPADTASHLVGQELQQYLILRWLGRGAMAIVYLAEQRSLRRQVAIKILKPELARDESYVRRFHREAQAAAALVHPNIVQIHEIGCAEGLHFIVQEYVSGHNLKQILQRQSAFSATDTLGVLRQVSSALVRAEQVGVVHRDIKPENILVDSEGQVKVADFGLARVLADRGQMELTQVGMTMGSPLYMSPEQIEGKDLDTRSDIYSLGATAYHMLTGRPPHDGESPLSLAMRKLQSDPPRIESFARQSPRDLCDLVHQMLSRDREQRPRASVLQERLAAFEVLESPAGQGDRRIGSHVSLVGHLAPTRRLAEALGRIRGSGQPGRALRWSPGTWCRIGAVVVGAGLAWAVIAPDPWRNVQAAKGWKPLQFESVESQFRFAESVDSESGWKSVIDYEDGNSRDLGPASRYYIRMAKLQLGRWYLERDRPTEALRRFRDLTQSEQPEREFRAAGFAGMTIASVGLNDWDGAKTSYREFLRLKDAFNRDGQAWYLQQELSWAEDRLRRQGM